MEILKNNRWRIIRTMKKKILAGILATAMLFLLTACGEKEDKEKTTEKVGVEEQTTSEEATENDTAQETTEGDTAEETGARWIMEVDFSAETIVAPEGLFYQPYFRDIDADTNTPAGTITYPIEKDDFDQYSIFFYADDSDEEDCVIYSTLDETLADTRLSTPEESQIEPEEQAGDVRYSLTSEKNKNGYISSIDVITVANASSEPKTYKECVDNGWFVQEFSFGDGALGLSEDARANIKDYDGDGYVYDEDILEYLVETWGPPTYFWSYDWDEDGSCVDDVVEGSYAGISSAMYLIAWEFDEYTIELNISDVYSGNRTVSIEASIYYDNEVWDVISSDNKIDEIIQYK